MPRIRFAARSAITELRRHSSRARAGSARRGHDVAFGLYFSILGWQVLFVAGLLAGHDFYNYDAVPPLTGPWQRASVGLTTSTITLVTRCRTRIGGRSRKIAWTRSRP